MAPTTDRQRIRVLRPHARGGLGAVFVALDSERHREVALTQILEKHVDTAVSRQRFVVKAEITGGLERPGVVPINGLGTNVGGPPYDAMPFIMGDSLKLGPAFFGAAVCVVRRTLAFAAPSLARQTAKSHNAG